MKLQITIDGKEYAVDLHEKADVLNVNVNGKDFDFKDAEGATVAQLAVAAPAKTMPRRDFSQKEVKAAIAGVISEISVKDGDVVEIAQKLLTLSAMKMENEIVAPCAGRIKEVRVKQGQKVKEGDILAVFA